jgi:hypothetical protein
MIVMKENASQHIPQNIFRGCNGSQVESWYITIKIAITKLILGQLKS